MTDMSSNRSFLDAGSAVGTPDAPAAVRSADPFPGGRRSTDVARLRGRTPLDPRAMVLSVLIPVYNERQTVELIVDQVRRALPGVRMEVICVDDCSTDGTMRVLEQLQGDGRIDRLIRHERNRGKGAAIRTALAASTGDVVLVQDADLEYDPADWPQLLAPLVEGKADAVAPVPPAEDLRRPVARPVVDDDDLLLERHRRDELQDPIDRPRFVVHGDQDGQLHGVAQMITGPPPRDAIGAVAHGS